MSRLLSCVLLFISFSVFSQEAFFSTRSNVMNNAANQWLVTELEKNNPSAFSDNQGGKSVIRIPAGTAAVAQLNSTYDVALANKFSQVYFPNGKSDRFLKINSLCNLYFPLIERKLLNAKLPLEYKYLPLVMTGFNASYEDERDRGGMWALEFLTARKWKLQIDTLVDERRGGDITTDAAVKELAEIHNHFNGKMTSVLKAWYISRAYAEKAHNKRTLTEDELDEEADLFVEFYIFTARLFSENQNNASNQLNAYFDILGNFESIAFKDTLNVTGLVSIVGLDENVLRKTNPVYIGQYIDPVYRRVTFIMDNRFSGKFRQLEDSVYKWQPPVKPIVYSEVIEEEEKVYHVVRKGEALGTIARKHKVSISNLKKWNKLKSDKIRAGQRLVIIKKTKKRKPLPETEVVFPNGAASDSTNVMLNPVPVDTVKVPEPPKPKPVPQPKKPKTDFITYTVKSGDSLWTIAKKYKVTPEQIMKWNKCGEKIRPGQKLKIQKKK